MRRVVLDSNGVDPIVKLPGAFDLVKRAVDDGSVELLSTHVVEEELTATGDPVHRANLLRVLELAQPVPTGAFVLNVSKLDRAELGDNEDIVEILRSSNVGNTNDALIGITADSRQVALITNEDRLTKRARECGIEVLTTLELLIELGYIPSDL